MYEVMNEYEDRNCMKNMYEVMMNMKTGIVWRICMKLWWIWRHELYEEHVWSYDEYEDMNCMKNVYEVMMNMKTGIVWRICMKLWRIWRHTGIVRRICMKLWWIWRQELYEEYVWSYMKNEYEDRNCMKNMYEVMKNMKDMNCTNEYEDRNCTKNMYEVIKNMKTGIVWRICMKLWMKL